MSLPPTTRNIQKQGKKGQLEFGGDQMLLFNTPNQCLKDGNFFFFFLLNHLASTVDTRHFSGRWGSNTEVLNKAFTC